MHLFFSRAAYFVPKQDETDPVHDTLPEKTETMPSEPVFFSEASGDNVSNSKVNDFMKGKGIRI